MPEIVYLEPNKKRLLQDIIFALQLGFQVIGAFVLAVILGITIDSYFDSKPIAILTMLLLAFIYVIKLLLGAGKHE